MSDTSLSALERINRICDRFVEAWLAGRRPRVADFLREAPEGDRPELRRELLGEAVFRIQADQRRRWEQGERVAVEEYLRDDPALGEEPERVLELVAHEVALRRERGEAPRADEYLGLLPGHEAELRRLCAAQPDVIPLTVDEPRAWDTMRPGTVAATMPANARPGEPVPPDLGRYQPRGFIGHGGVGDVFWVYDPQMDRELAVKVLREEHRGNPTLVRRFRKEARITSRLQHPNVVPVHAMERTADGRPFFTMKLVKGRTLADLLKERASPAQDLPRSLATFGQVCQALGYAHSEGVLHRDLKPSNVMVGAFGEVQVMDWGFAKVLGPAAEGEDAAAGREPLAPAPGVTVDVSRETQRGHVMGTLAYMPPEQARGEVDRVDRRSDVFGLGAILCEVLTGRPPFRGKDAEEVLVRAQACDHAEALARLDGCGADAELVRLCKDCLAAEPAGRPGDAGAVAQVVAAYSAEVQERLRRAELEKAAAEARAEEAKATAAAERRARRRALGLAAAVLLLVLGGGGSLLWWAWQRMEQRRGVEADWTEFEAALKEWKVEKAQTALERSEGRVAGGGPEELLGHVHRMRDYMEAVRELEEIRLRASVIVGNTFDEASADRGYAAFFSRRGIASEGEDTEAVAIRLRESPIRAQLVAALEDWARATESQRARRAWLLEIARRADPGPWSDRARDLAVWENPLALQGLAGRPEVATLPPSLLTTLGRVVAANRVNSAPLLMAAQARAPGDFWLNFTLGNVLRKTRPAEAIGYYRAALAVRPNAGVVYTNLGQVLVDNGRAEEAIVACQKALELDPSLAVAFSNLGIALVDTGRLDEGITAFRKAVALDAGDARALNNLCIALRHKRRLDEAIAAGQKAVALAPTLAEAHVNLGNALADKDLLDEAVASYHKAIDLDPLYAKAHNNLGSALSRQGRKEDAMASYRKAIEIDPRYSNAYYNLAAILEGKALLDDAILAYRKVIEISPGDAEAHIALGNVLKSKGFLDQAVAAYRKAIELTPKDARAHYCLGNTLAAQGRPKDAEAALREALQIKEDYPEAHCNLGHMLRGQGRFEEALVSFKRGHELGSKQPGWRYPSARWVDNAERLVALDTKLTAALKGPRHPVDAAESLALAQLCLQYKKLPRAAALFYADAFTAEPKLAADLRSGHRYNAACAAALTGGGQGEDARDLEDEDRARLRKRALDWLQADLTAWTKVLDNGPPQARQVVAQTLQRWQKAPDLVGLREKPALDKLPTAERDAWQRLWADVAALLKRAQEK